MLTMAVLGDWQRLRDHVVTLGIGIGALLAALLFAVPAAGTALATAIPTFGSHDMMQELFVTQIAWIGTAAIGIVGYGLARKARQIRSARSLSYEVIALGVGAALIPAATYNVTLLLVLVPGALAGVSATLLEEVPRPVVVLTGLLATIAFVVTFIVAHWLSFGSVAELLIGIAVVAYAIGRWTDLHPASVTRPTPLLWASLACGFVLVFKA